MLPPSRAVRHALERGLFVKKQAWYEVKLLLPKPSSFSSQISFFVDVRLSRFSQSVLTLSLSKLQVVSSNASITGYFSIKSISASLVQRTTVQAQGQGELPPLHPEFRLTSFPQLNRTTRFSHEVSSRKMDRREGRNSRRRATTQRVPQCGRSAAEEVSLLSALSDPRSLSNQTDAFFAQTQSVGSFQVPNLKVQFFVALKVVYVVVSSQLRRRSSPGFLSQRSRSEQPPRAHAPGHDHVGGPAGAPLLSSSHACSVGRARTSPVLLCRRRPRLVACRNPLSYSPNCPCHFIRNASFSNTLPSPSTTSPGPRHQQRRSPCALAGKTTPPAGVQGTWSCKGRGTTSASARVSVALPNSRELDPILGLVARQKRLRTRRNVSNCARGERRNTHFELITTAVRHGALVESDGEPLEETDGDVAMLERESFAEEATGRVDPHRVRSPVLDAVVCELADHVEAFARAEERGSAWRRLNGKKWDAPDVPVSALLDFGKDPRLEGTPSAWGVVQGEGSVP